MICILKQKRRQPFTQPAFNLVEMIDGWIIATDLADARRQAHAACDERLAAELYRMEGEVPLPVGVLMMRIPGYVLLKS